MKKHITLLITLLTLVTFGQSTENQLKKFIKKEKTFTKKESLNKILTEKINAVALDFIVVSKSKESKNKKYQERIGHGICRFDAIDTELNAVIGKKIYIYFKEIVTIIELESAENQNYASLLYRITKYK